MKLILSLYKTFCRMTIISGHKSIFGLGPFAEWLRVTFVENRVGYNQAHARLQQIKVNQKSIYFHMISVPTSLGLVGLGHELRF